MSEEDITDKLVRRGSKTGAKTPAKPKSKPKTEKAPAEIKVDDSLPMMAAEEGHEAGPKIMLGLPWVKSTHPMVAFALMALIKLKKENVIIVPKCGDSMIYHARNKLAKRFLESDCEYLMMVDDDTVVPVGNPDLLRTLLSLPDSFPFNTLNHNAIDRMVSQKKDVVGLTYWQRKDNGAPLFASGLSEVNARRQAREGRNGLIQTKWVGTGAIMIHRSVFERIREHYGDKLIQPEECGSYGYFYPDMFGGEDTSFCRRAREAGCQVFADVGCQALHIGFKVYGAHTAIQT